MKNKKYLILFIFIFIGFMLFGCLSVDQKTCDNMNFGEVHDECYINVAVNEYLKTNNLSVGSICKNKMDLDESTILCYKSLAVAAAYSNYSGTPNNYHAVSFCEDLWEISNDRGYKHKYENMIDCLTEIAIILGDEGICEHAENRFDEKNSFLKIFFDSSSAIPNMKKDICIKRAILSKKRLNNTNKIFK